jgi:CheY-like chemotaxis protein
MKPDNSNEHILSSWKEIAAYLGKSIRTVQRWETLGMPVRRPHGVPSNVVLAIDTELTEWHRQFIASGGERKIADDSAERMQSLKEKLQSLAATIASLEDQVLALKSAVRATESTSMARAISVLAVDDDEIHRYVIGKLLEASGFEVRLAIDGDDALRSTAQSKPDVILLDINLPGLSGFEVCAALRSNTNTNDVPVIFHTAYSANEVNHRRATDSGACAFLTYPIVRDHLVTVINQCVEKGVSVSPVPEAH